MNKKLAGLFDYQRFENNPRIAGLIRETEARAGTAKELCDDDLFMVSAAGETAVNSMGNNAFSMNTEEKQPEKIIPSDDIPF